MNVSGSGKRSADGKNSASMCFRFPAATGRFSLENKKPCDGLLEALKSQGWIEGLTTINTCSLSQISWKSKMKEEKVMNMFRVLRSDEIDCRIAQIKTKDNKPTGISLLLYKDARCDQNILDEVVGPYKWKREHTRDNRNCIVSIWSDELQQWISKEDTGTESNTEREKGLASDSFKRACFNWGIGRELYTAPFIWINASDCNIRQNNGKTACYENFTVQKIVYKEGVIVELQIKNQATGKICYSWKADKEENERRECE